MHKHKVDANALRERQFAKRTREFKPPESRQSDDQFCLSEPVDECAKMEPLHTEEDSIEKTTYKPEQTDRPPIQTKNNQSAINSSRRIGFWGTLAIRWRKVTEALHYQRYTLGKPRSKLIPRVITTFAILFFVGGCYMTFSGVSANKTAVAQAQQISQQSQNSEHEDNVDDFNPNAKQETPPSQQSIEDYRVAPDMPRLITIPSIGVKARIRRMGVDKNGAVMAPASVFDAGWYDGSAKPGENGAAFIDGHVSGYASKGIFGNLKKLSNGDSIQVVMGNGNVVTYKVTNKRTYPKDSVDMNQVLNVDGSAKSGLNIMTCAGKFDAKSNSFLDRLVIFAVRE